MTIVTIPVEFDTPVTNTFHPETVVGSHATLWGDLDDATYVEFWRSRREGVGVAGGAASGITAPHAGLALSDVTLFARLEILNELDATSVGGVGVNVQRASDDSFLGSLFPVAQPDTLATIYELTDWTFIPDHDGALAEMGAALPDGLRLQLVRFVPGGEDAGVLDGDWGMRAYEFALIFSTAGYSPLRRYPRTYNRHYPHTPNRRAGKSY